VTPVEYRTGGELELDEVIELYVSSTLAERRPADDRARMAEMLAHANLVVWAREGRCSSGSPARSPTGRTRPTCPTSRCAPPISAGASAASSSRERTRRRRVSRLILLSAPGAVDYYGRIGMERHPAAFTLPPKVG
jgi:hypothetical protein